MKKFIYGIAVSLVLGLAGMASAEVRNIPSGPGGALSSADYGGVEIATVSYSSASVLLFGKGGGSVSFIHFTTVPAVTDFAILRATNPSGGGVNDAQYLAHVSNAVGSAISGGNANSGDYNTTNEMFRVFGATAAVGITPGAIVTGFDYTPKSPMKFPHGAIFKLNNVNWGPVTIGYTKFGK